MRFVKKPRVMIVEDEVLIAELIEGLLSDMDYPVVGRFRKGREAIAALDDTQPDVIIMDIHLPDINGIDATQQISDAHPTPIVILTAYDDSELVKKASEAGAGAYLLKPADARELERAIMISIARFEDMMAHRALSEQLIREINVRKETEQSLEEINRFLNFIIDSVNTWFAVFDESQQVKIWNKAAEKISGYSKKDIEENPKIIQTILVNPPEYTILFPGNETLFEKTSSVEVTILTRAGDLKMLSLAAKRLQDETGILGYVTIAIDMTEQKQAEQAFYESEERLHTLIENSEDLISFYDNLGVCVYYNAPSNFPIQSSIILGKRSDELFPGSIGKEIQQQIETVNRTHSTLTVDNEIVWQGENYWFSDHIFPVYDEFGYVHRIAKFSRNISERKKIEEALRESETKYRILFENARESILSIDPDGKILNANSASAALLGFDTNGHMIHQPLKACFSDPALFDALLNKVKREGVVERFETSLQKRSNPYEEVQVIGSITQQSDAGDTLNHYEVLFMDITERKQNEEKLQSLLMFQNEMLDTPAVWINSINTAGYVTFWNRAAERISGYSRKQVIGNDSMWQLLYPNSRVRKRIMAQILGLKSRHERLENWETTIRRNDGEERMISWRVGVLENSEMQVMGMIALGIDVTQSKKIEQALKDSQDLLRNYSAHLQIIREEERTLIAREIHDELGQALTALKMDVSWLRKKQDAGAEAFNQKTQTMTALIDQTIQTVKRISTELRPGLLDDLGLTAALEWQTEEFMKRTGIPCRLTIHPEEMTVTGELSTAIFRIVQEALTNIMRHARATRVDVRFIQNNRHLELTIRDNGIGISPDQLNHPNSFGLIGIKERVQHLGGVVDIAGVPDGGTTIQLTVPLQPVEAE